jgi:hypothetical protein
LDDDAHDGRIKRRDALRKAAAIGGALWVAPAVQTVNMTRAWAAVGSDLGSDPGRDQGPGSGSDPGPTVDRYTVRFEIGARGAMCSSVSGRSCRCLDAEQLAGGCSFVRADRNGWDGQWTVTVSGEGAEVVEGFSVCGDRHGCDPGSPMGTNAMTFRAHRPHGRTRRPHGIKRIEVTFAVVRPPTSEDRNDRREHRVRTTR